MWTGVLLGTIGRVSSETWPSLWLILEINLMAFITFIAGRWSAKKTRMIYFVVQSIGRLVVLRGGVVTDTRSQLSHWVLLGMLLKTSLAPLHFWGAAIIVKLSKHTAAMFLTWQKIAPIFIIILTAPKALLHIILIMNMLVSSRCGIGSKNLYVLLFFSGLLHIRWLLTSPMVVASTYFFLYRFSTLPIILTDISIDLPILIMNMAGLPPLTGFIIKLNALQHIRMSYGILLLSLSTPLLYAYIRNFLFSRIRNRGSLNALTILVCILGLIF